MSQRRIAACCFASLVAAFAAASVAFGQGEMTGPAPYSGATNASRYKIIDSLVKNGLAGDAAIAATIAQQILSQPGATRDDTARIQRLNLPLSAAGSRERLSIVSITPDTASSGEKIAIALSRGLRGLATSQPGDGVEVVFGIHGAKVDSISPDGRLIVTTVPRGAARGTQYSVVVRTDSDTSEAYSRFVAGFGIWQVLTSPSLWPSQLGSVLFSLVALGFVVVTTVRSVRNSSKQAAELKDAQTQVEQLTRLRHPREVSDALLGLVPTLAPPISAFLRPKEIVAPPVPDALVEAIAAGQAVLYAGAGLSALANYPTTYELLSALLAESPQDEGELSPALAAGRFEEVSELLLSRRGRDRILASVSRLLEGDTGRTTVVQSHLVEMPFVGAVSTTWDSLLEQHFQTVRPQGVRVLNSAQTDTGSQGPATEEFVIAKPFGSIASPETFLFTLSEALRALQRNKNFSRTLAAMLGSNSVFFMGTSLRGIQDLLASAQLTLSDKPHFALVAQQDATPLQQELFRTKYGIELIPYDPTPGYPEVALFVQHLSERVAKQVARSTKPVFQKAVLTAVTLTNIGAFTSLTVKFNSQWNVILGNNGSGKSTLLRAIALGICGDDVDTSKSAKRLLRVGPEPGTIELLFGDTKYTTRLYRDGDSVRIESQFTPLQQGKWVVMGFPPLRGVSTRDPSGIGVSGPAKPVVDDLHPLIKGSIDDRLNNLKQWLVNIDSGMRSNDPEERDRNSRLHASFWSVLKQLTPGVSIEPGRVKASIGEVMVRTEDGEVSIDQVSQGMSSVFGWIGAALQRMYEIHSRAEYPEREPALILVDEIDAHLHPEWQQRLIPLLRATFPNLQIIATSHSPLLVAGLKSEEVFVASRDDDNRSSVNILPVPDDVNFELLRFDQILTSPLFGLVSTRSDASKKEYVKLAAIPADKRTAEENKRYEALRAMLLDSTQPQSTAQGRQLADTVRDAVSEAVQKNFDPEELHRQGKLTPELVAEYQARMNSIAPASGVEPVKKKAGGFNL